GCVRVEALEEQALWAGFEAPKKGKLRQQRPIAAGEVLLQARLLQDLAPDDTKLQGTPAGVGQHLPEPLDSNGTIADGRAIGPLQDTRFGIDIAPSLAIEWEGFAVLVYERRVAVGKHDVRVFV